MEQPKYKIGDKVEYDGRTCEVWWVSKEAPYLYRVHYYLNYIPEDQLKPAL